VRLFPSYETWKVPERRFVTTAMVVVVVMMMMMMMMMVNIMSSRGTYFWRRRCNAD
jgi:hypothetical protein